jgi:hypothetical protein
VLARQGAVLQFITAEGRSCVLTWADAARPGSQDRADPTYISRAGSPGFWVTVMAMIAIRQSA